MARSRCPNHLSGPIHCSHAEPEQRKLDRERLVAAGLDGEWLWTAMQCVYCKYIYSIEKDGSKVVRGYFEGDLIKPDHWRQINID